MNKRFGLNNFSNKEITEETYIQFHKLIADDDEEGAIKLLKEHGDFFNVNYQYKNRIPVFSAINNRMYYLYDEITNHPMFDCGIKDEFGETLLELLLYLSCSDEIPMTANDTESLYRMIRTVLNNKKFDFNATDLNNDTAINVACEYPKLIWVVEELVNKECVNPNIINIFGDAALTNAIRNDNVDAIKLLSKRKDLIVRNKDIEVAKEEGISLSRYGL